ncbi:hypothetical protein [Streptomyces sp. NPDC048606]|uniref:hypothetical protein n=1 Tax=Streptomyces sp. NPDC048606 TaxID=3154726 RepID=UPI003448F763
MTDTSASASPDGPLSEAPSGFLRVVLRADAFAASSAGTITLIAILLALVFTDTVAGIVAAVLLFAGWVAVGLTGRRHQRLTGGRNRPAGDR